MVVCTRDSGSNSSPPCHNQNNYSFCHAPVPVTRNGLEDGALGNGARIVGLWLKKLFQVLLCFSFLERIDGLRGYFSLENSQSNSNTHKPTQTHRHTLRPHSSHVTTAQSDLPWQQMASFRLAFSVAEHERTHLTTQTKSTS